MTIEANAENAPAMTTPTAPAPQSAPASPPQITPDIEAMIAAREQAAAQRAHDAAWKQARTTFEAKAKGQAPQPARSEQANSDTPRAPAEDLQALLNRQRSFDRVVAKYDLPESALAILEADFATAKPDDPASWVTARAQAFGWKPLGTMSNPTNQPAPGAPAPTPAPANGQPVTAGGATPAQQPVRTDKMIHQLSPADQRELAAQLGPIEFKNRLWKEMARVQVNVGRR